MKKRTITMLSLVIMVCLTAATIYSQGVLKGSKSSPAHVVAVRKFAMKTMGANVGDIRGKIGAGNIKGIGANAGSIAALATFLPLVYQDPYGDVYPVAGSKYFYKGKLSDIEVASEQQRAEAEKLMGLASVNNKSAVEAQVEKLLGACGNCHKLARGKY